MQWKVSFKSFQAIRLQVDRRGCIKQLRSSRRGRRDEKTKTVLRIARPGTVFSVAGFRAGARNGFASVRLHRRVQDKILKTRF